MGKPVWLALDQAALDAPSALGRAAQAPPGRGQQQRGELLKAGLPVLPHLDRLAVARARLVAARDGARRGRLVRGDLDGVLRRHPERMAGVEMTHVAYRGTPEALSDVAGGRLTAMASPFGPALPLIEGGRLRALAAAGATRLPWMPHLPTVAEGGLAGFDAGSWLALAAPRATPAAVIEQLSAFVQEVMNDAALKPAMDRNALVPDTMGPAATLAVWRREHEAWGRVIRAAGIQAG